MLTELFVSNLAVLERIRAVFGPGLNAVTGETGAGKSLLIGALDLVLGARASADLVRQGAKQAEVVARFEIEPGLLSDGGIEDESIEDGVIVLRRLIGVDGRSRAYVNDRPATLTRLRVLGAALADLHGQHEQQNLLHEHTHIEYLDAFTGCRAERASMAAAFADYLQAMEAHRAFMDQSRRGAEEQDFLRFQLDELDAAELISGEEEELAGLRRRAAHAGRLAEAITEAQGALGGEDAGAEARLEEASRALGHAAGLDPGLEPLRRQLDDALVSVQETTRELEHYAAGLEVDPEELERVERRLELLAGLRRKHNTTHGGLLEHREELRQILEAIEETPGRMAALEAAMAERGDRAAVAATELSALRSRGAASLSRKVTAELKGLGMEGARFSITLRPPRQGEIVAGRNEPVGPRGAEEAVFMLAANPGEPGGPLSKIASGGEASRVMLALKNVLRRVDPVPLVIFDEVDAGIGGLVAEAVATRLSAIAAERQVLVVTHLAMIAGRARHHVRLAKRTDKKRTKIDVETLTGDSREEELARMLAGSAGGEDARRTARAILNEGHPG